MPTKTSYADYVLLIFLAREFATFFFLIFSGESVRKKSERKKVRIHVRKKSERNNPPGAERGVVANYFFLIFVSAKNQKEKIRLEKIRKKKVKTLKKRCREAPAEIWSAKTRP